MNKIKFLLAAFAFVFSMTTVSAQDMGKHAKAKVNKHAKMDNHKAMHSDITVIELTQVDGAFVQNGLTLKPGKYKFNVTNTEVDHEVGFVIQKAADKNADVMKTAVENSFAQEMIKVGETQSTGVVELKAGEYVYSCPLNPTPKYTITVK